MEIFLNIDSKRKREEKVVVSKVKANKYKEVYTSKLIKMKEKYIEKYIDW